jgi:hypothetical protein
MTAATECRSNAAPRATRRAANHSTVLFSSVPALTAGTANDPLRISPKPFFSPRGPRFFVKNFRRPAAQLSRGQIVLFLEEKREILGRGRLVCTPVRRRENGRNMLASNSLQ